ncbi:MAG TPA: hypothetical protein VGB45_16440 [Abditibacterium sp.]|jgi:hypothetical protein
MHLRLFLSLTAVLVVPWNVNAAPKKSVAKEVRRTVVDYFRLLPRDAGIFEAENRESLIGRDVPHLIDRKNDYMQVMGDGAQPSFQIAVFRYRGRDLVAVSSDSRVGDYSFNLWRFDKRRWKKVTSSVSSLILAKDDNLHFVLPRYGTTIKVFRHNGTLAAQLFWENGSFGAKNFDPLGHRIDGPS